jgi:hypothetical protein
MTLGKTAGLTAGLIGAFGLGIAVGPSLMHRQSQTTSAPAAAVSDDAAAGTAQPVRPAGSTAATRKAFNRNKVVIVAPATHPELQRRLKPVLNRGADLEKAADGFRNGEEFATVAHAARNTQVPFMLLKHRVLEERMSLDAAIRASKPDADARAEATRARTEAKADVADLAL